MTHQLLIYEGAQRRALPFPGNHGLCKPSYRSVRLVRDVREVIGIPSRGVSGMKKSIERIL